MTFEGNCVFLRLSHLIPFHLFLEQSHHNFQTAIGTQAVDYMSCGERGHTKLWEIN